MTAMFKFFGRLGRKQFLWAAALRIGLFVASVIGFPFFLMALATMSNCRSVGGACGAVALVGAVAFKPTAFVLFVFSMAGICVRRARDAGVPGWVGLFIPLMFAVDANFLIFAGAPWSFAFSAGAMLGAFPRHVLLGLACTAALGALPARAESGPRNPYGLLGVATLSLMIIISFFGSVGILFAFPAMLPFSLPVARVSSPVGWLAPYLMIGLAALLAFMVWRERNHVAAAPGGSVPQVTQQPVRPPLKTLLLVALMPTVLAIGAGLPDGLFPIVLVTQFTSMVLPTLLIYFFPLLAMFLLIVRRTPQMAALVALSLLPFAHWAYAHWQSAQEHGREVADIAAIPTTPAADIPKTIVFESRNTTGIRGGLATAGIERVVSKGAYSNRLMQFDRGSTSGPRPVAELPDTYLLLKVGRASFFSKDRQIYASAGGPLELRYIGAGRDDLVAVWYRVFNPSPTRAPILTTAGWFRGSNSASTDEIDATVQAFLQRALKPAG
jgi:uncharacterized membrane protein YhaH (DUF805 family)